jgi:hypothetical protein
MNIMFLCKENYTIYLKAKPYSQSVYKNFKLISCLINKEYTRQ